MNMHSSTEKLIYYANTLFDPSIEKVAMSLLSDGNFDIWSGSGKVGQHHHGKHGLTIHTLEVVELGFNCLKTLNLPVELMSEYYLAALFHDSGKLYDYTCVNQELDTWVGTEHKRKIHHISRSALIWHDAILISPEIFDTYHDSVIHDILSHHGMRIWGSPVMPKTNVAWLLHHCDSISARLNDWETIDMVTK